MARGDITVRRDNGGRTAMPAPLTEWEPFRLMRDFMGFDPFQEMQRFMPALERPAVFIPAFEIRESADAYIFKADVPGVTEHDIDVLLTGNRLTISGKREAERLSGSETYYSYERPYGAFTRAFTLPEGIDTEHVKTELRDGVLTLTLAKRPEVKARRIPITATDKASIKA